MEGERYSIFPGRARTLFEEHSIERLDNDLQIMLYYLSPISLWEAVNTFLITQKTKKTI